MNPFSKVRRVDVVSRNGQFFSVAIDEDGEEKIVDECKELKPMRTRNDSVIALVVPDEDFVCMRSWQKREEKFSVLMKIVLWAVLWFGVGFAAAWLLFC